MITRISTIFFLILFCLTTPAASEEKNIKDPDLSRPINPAALDGRTLQDLWLLRNGIYARHGKPFKDYELHSYFLSKGYKPDRDYSDKRLSKTELNNIEIIRSRENELLKNNYVVKNGEKAVNLDNILNQFQFGTFSEEHKKRLRADGFFVSPARHEQLFHVYENNDYLGIPSFITTDTVLQLYSIFFDFTLRHIEEEILVKKLSTLSSELLKHSRIAYKASREGILKGAAKANLAYFTVPLYFLTRDKKIIDKDVKSLVMEEIGLVEKHTNIHSPAILKSNKPEYGRLEKIYWVDYSQFIPRGHYTRSEVLEKYFMAMLWFGLYPFHIEPGFEHEIVQGLITTHLLYNKTYEGRPLIELWREIYGPTAFYVGFSDDIGPDDFKDAMDKVYGKVSDMKAFADKEKLAEVRKIISEVFKGKTRIKQEFNGESQGPRFMLMGQRYIPDSEVMQRLVNLARLFPKSLDVMAVFGNKPAKDLMLTRYKDDWRKGFPDYPKELEKLISEFGLLKERDWRKNLYTNWIWGLKSLLELNADHKYPFFMQSAAWAVKDLNTSLASWTELRHHTILYAKQSFIGMECGGGSVDQLVWVPEPPKGYVEPNVEFYKRLKDLLTQSRDGLKGRGMLDGELKNLFARFSELVEFLERVSDKELKNEPRTVQEYEQIRRLGSLIENISVAVIGPGYRKWNDVAGVDKRVPLVADVHTAYDFGKISSLEEGVGFANDIYVVVEIEGKLKLTRGAVFSYYEFKWPAADRLTDEKWQDMLDEGKQPAMPEWSKVFISDDPHVIEKPVYMDEEKPDGEATEEKEISIPLFELPTSEPGWRLIHYDTGC